MPVLKSAVEEKKETKEFKRSPSHRLSSYVNNNTRAFVYPEPNVLYMEEIVFVTIRRNFALHSILHKEIATYLIQH
jgi:hypothetical protein